MLPADDKNGAPVIALMPKSILLALHQESPPKRLELPSGAPKSWYLQAGTPAETRAWREVLSLASDPAPLQVLGQQ